MPDSSLSSTLGYRVVEIVLEPLVVAGSGTSRVLQVVRPIHHEFQCQSFGSLERIIAHLGSWKCSQAALIWGTVT